MDQLCYSKADVAKVFRAFYEPSQQLSDRIFNCIDRAHLIDMGCALNHSKILSDSSPLSSPQASGEQSLFFSHLASLAANIPCQELLMVTRGTKAAITNT